MWSGYDIDHVHYPILACNTVVNLPTIEYRLHRISILTYIMSIETFKLAFRKHFKCFGNLEHPGCVYYLNQLP